MEHDLRVVKNVTISMADADLAWVRAQAGAAGLSVSRWIAERVLDRRQRQSQMAAASRRLEAIYASLQADYEADRLAGVVYEPRTQSIREMINEGYDERFRRFDHVDLSTGSDRTGEGSHLRGVAEVGAGFDDPDRQPSGPE